ncbi:alpha/beta hydrolase [Acidocella sp.]|uniref:alpha/beta hydrolase n=1 Tax=Acidocella sp. TaxID=50710 RepID=UPI002618047C|nr:alpha/beta hydrolase [Acidocella sp.]
MRALHPDVLRLIALTRAAQIAPLDALPPAEARRNYAIRRDLVQPPPPPIAVRRELTMPGPGGELRLRLYRDAAEDGALLPGLVYFHGGGWVLGDLDSHEGLCRQLARGGGCVVLSVDYRLAPEHPFPAAVEDAAAAFRWAAAEAGTLGIDSSRLAVGGDSAGGNLAAVVAQMARDGALPPCDFQLLLYPATDLAADTPSYVRVPEDMPLSGRIMRWFINQYTPDPTLRADPRASPARAASLAGTAPALVLTCGEDPLCDEGRAYADRLEAEGVAVTALHLADQIHGILTMGRLISAVSGVVEFCGATLRQHWAGKETQSA